MPTHHKPIPGETFGEAEARITEVIFKMAQDREGHWITRIWATYQLVQMAYAKRKRERAQWDFIEKLFGRKGPFGEAKGRMQYLRDRLERRKADKGQRP